MDCASVSTHLEKDLVVTVYKPLNISALRGRRPKLCFAKGKMDLWKATFLWTCHVLMLSSINAHQ